MTIPALARFAAGPPAEPVADLGASFRAARGATRPDAGGVPVRRESWETAWASWRGTGAALHAEASATAPASGTINDRTAAAMGNATFMAMPPWVGAEP
jgi:hypothetical protein